ncbi:sulfotransferase domain protein [bacterium BMS3Abin07]|nr:sulfotransferase domain protein [bacterium BMS3Abin07]HDK41883.1 hypothetical protein [Candidatus Pacearchaeota archaeon]
MRINRVLRTYFKSFQEYIEHLLLSGSYYEKIPVSVVGVQRSGTTMLLNILQHSPECSVYHEGNKEAYDNFRIKPDNKIKRLIKMNKKRIIIIKPINDLQYTDRFLEIHHNAKAVWIYRDYHDVINSAVKKWGEAQKNMMLGISKGYIKHPGQNALSERMTSETLRLVRKIANEKMSSADGAALLWYIRNLLYFDLNLHENRRVLIVKYEDLINMSLQRVERIFNFISCTFNEVYTYEIFTSSVRKTPAPIINLEIEILCKELMDRLNEHYLFQRSNF